MTHSFLLFVVYAMAVFRITRFVTSDTLTDNAREWLRVKSHTEYVKRDLLTQVVVNTKTDTNRSLYSWTWKLVTCPWCLSVWASTGVVLFAYFQGSWFVYVAYVLALSGVTGFLAEKL